jgi:hypothetical protein
LPRATRIAGARDAYSQFLNAEKPDFIAFAALFAERFASDSAGFANTRQNVHAG